MSTNIVYFELPELITLQEYNGNFEQYLEVVYSVFNNDFIVNRPNFRGKRLGLKKHPLYKNKEATFWHLTSDGKVEQDRLPDLRRLERIGWPSPMINKSEHQYLKVWRNRRGNDESILIWHEKEEYLVVLRDRGEYILPWTAYLVQNKAQKLKLMKEYGAYIKAETA